MSWDIDCESWELFPVAQKWFATGEALAHLRYLEGEGRIRRNGGQKVFTFSVVGTETATRRERREESCFRKHPRNRVCTDRMVHSSPDESRWGYGSTPPGPGRRLLRLGCRSR